MRVLAAPERLVPAVSRDLGIQPDREHRRVGMRRFEREPHGRGRFVPGQDLVVAGCIGKAGALAAMEKRKEALEARFHGVFLGPSEWRRRDLWICPRNFLRILA